MATLQPPSSATGASPRIAASAPLRASGGSSPAPHEASDADPVHAGRRLDDQHALRAERHPDPLGRLAREVARRDAAQRALAERGDRGLLVGLPAQPRARPPGAR